MEYMVISSVILYQNDVSTFFSLSHFVSVEANILLFAELLWFHDPSPKKTLTQGKVACFTEFLNPWHSLTSFICGSSSDRDEGREAIPCPFDVKGANCFTHEAKLPGSY